jgi:hypothetical protein
LSDHIISHMSSGFVSIWCAGCREAFRNRQALFRHQRGSSCTGSYYDGDLSLSVLADMNEMVRILGTSRSLSTDIIVRKRPLEMILKEASQGLHQSLSHIDLGGEGTQQCVLYEDSNIPMQIISSTHVGVQAVFLKSFIENIARNSAVELPSRFMSIATSAISRDGLALARVPFEVTFGLCRFDSSISLYIDMEEVNQSTC